MRAISILRMLIYTGARLSEILTLQWTWIQWEGGFARLPDSKTGTKTVPLPQPALGLLRRISDEEGRSSKFVFPGKRPRTHFTGIQKPWQRIRLRAGLPDVRIHDLRHCFASTASPMAKAFIWLVPCWAIVRRRRRSAMPIWPFNRY